MSIKHNVVANFVGQFYVIFIGILILPLYLKFLGGEAYGLVGFFTLIQAWMRFLDIGMTPTLYREVARLKEKSDEKIRLVTVVNSLETIFFIIAFFIWLGLLLSRTWIATDWLKVEELPISTVTTAISIIAITVAVRWISSLNRSGINAYEAQIWVNLFDIVINTFRFPGAFLLIWLTDGSVLAFFYFQLVVVLCEVFIIRWKFRKLLPKVLEGVQRFSFYELKRIAPFALSVGYTGAVWVLLTQLDKLLLSKFMTLSEYGYFTLIATITSGLGMLSGPISKAILPRMTALLAAQREEEMLTLYRRSTRVVVSITVPVVLVIALLPEVVVYVWTGDLEAASWAAPILPLFVLGGGLVAIIAFQYYLQFAYGYLRLHVLYNTLSVIINVPLISYAAFNYGAVGVGWVWLAFRVFSFFVWVPFIHYRFAKGLHIKWLFRDVLPPVLISLFVIFWLTHLDIFVLASGRYVLLGALVSLTSLAVLLAFTVSMQDIIRRKIFG